MADLLSRAQCNYYIRKKSRILAKQNITSHLEIEPGTFLHDFIIVFLLHILHAQGDAMLRILALL